MQHAPIDFVWLCGTAFLAGGVNALAGGGTLLTFPTLISIYRPQFGNLADVLANGTSTVALGPASLGSAWGFRRELAELRPLILWLLAPSFIGGVLGALLVIEFPNQFNALVPWLILVAATLFLLQPLLVPRKTVVIASTSQRSIGSVPPAFSGNRIAGMIALQFVIAVYGGYFGAGIGILMLTGLGLMGFTNIHQMNGVKSVLATAINGVAAAVFAWQGKIIWFDAFAMMAASVSGGYLAAYFGRQIPGTFIRYFVVLVGFLLAAWFFAHR